MAKPKKDETTAEKVVSRKQLIALIRESNVKTGEIQSISGELGERVQNAVENGHMHRGAFRLMTRLAKLDDLKREDFIRSINLYVDMCREEGLFRAEHAGDLVEMAEDGEGDEEDDKDLRLRQSEEDRRADTEAKAGEVNAEALAAGIKPLEEKKNGRAKKGALDGADAAGTTLVQ